MGIDVIVLISNEYLSNNDASLFKGPIKIIFSDLRIAFHAFQRNEM